MKILDLQQNTPEWEAFRLSVIGASDIGILMEGTEREIYELMQVKRGTARKFVTDAMRRGSEMEEEAVSWLVGHAVKSAEKICALMDAPDDWLMASFDYIDVEKQYLAEIKCPKFVHQNIRDQSHYNRWWWQVQAQLAVSGLSKGTLLAYSPVNQVKEWVERDEEAIAQLKEKGKWFHDLMINFEDLPTPNEVLERFDTPAAEWARCFRDIDDKLKALEEEKRVLREEGIAIAEDTPFVCEGVKVSKIAMKETIDYEAACKAHGIDISAFKKKPKVPFTWRVSPISSKT